MNYYYYYLLNKLKDLFFPGPQAFCKKAVERVRSEKNILYILGQTLQNREKVGLNLNIKNILNSSVEWSVWSGCSGWSGVGGVVLLEKAICMYIIRSGSMS